MSFMIWLSYCLFDWLERYCKVDAFFHSGVATLSACPVKWISQGGKMQSSMEVGEYREGMRWNKRMGWQHLKITASQQSLTTSTMFLTTEKFSWMVTHDRENLDATTTFNNINNLWQVKQTKSMIGTLYRQLEIPSGQWQSNIVENCNLEITVLKLYISNR